VQKLQNQESIKQMLLNVHYKQKLCLWWNIILHNLTISAHDCLSRLSASNAKFQKDSTVTGYGSSLNELMAEELTFT